MAENRSHESNASNVIYYLAIGAIIALMLLLPYIRVDLCIKCSGLLRPAVEMSTIRVPSSGQVSQVFVSLNQHILKGQEILSLDSVQIEKKISFIAEEIDEDKLRMNDLMIMAGENRNTSMLSTQIFRDEYQSYLRKKRDLVIKYDKAKKDYNRNLKLHQEKVIADAELENLKFELDRAYNEIELLKQSHLSQWQTQLVEYQKEVNGHEIQLEQMKREKDDLVIRAPINGSIQNLSSIQSGSYVFANQEIAQISPDTSSVVEAYVAPSDIGMLTRDMPVRFQVDAFNYNQWGLATGKVLEISNDINFINEKPVFKVRCSLDQEYLQLKNGYKGYFKKGMTLQARFVVTKRTLWQLLYDRVDDWLNPNIPER